MAMSDTERSKKWRLENPDKAREISQRYRDKLRSKGKAEPAVAARRNRRLREPAKSLFQGALYRARKFDIPFDISVDDIVIPRFFPVLGVEIVLDQPRHRYGPSIDRLDPALGYTKGNVAVISMEANRLKSNLSVEVLRSLLAYLDAYQITDLT